MKFTRTNFVLGCLCLLTVFLISPVLAVAQHVRQAVQESVQATAPSMPSERPDSFLAGPEVAGHTAWMLVCSAMVLFMTAPGLALYYGGLVRKKNVLSLVMQCVFLMGLMSVIWALYGYSLAFSGTNPFLGNLKFVFMNGVARTWSEAAREPMTPMHNIVPTLPRMLHMIFQGMFFIITPAIMCGAFAERMRFSAMVAFSVLWGTFVYCPLAHWVWGGGLLSYGSANAILGGSLDFAGGTVVHISSGVSALVAAFVIGPRLGHRHEPMPPHNLTYSTIGATMLWVGWFGFNAGNAKAADGLAINAFVATHFAASAGAVVWAAIEWLKRGRPSVLGTCSGALAGLVCISPAAGHVGPMASLLIGGLAGSICYLSCSMLKAKCGYDDSLDAFGIHGVGGTLGAVLTGIFASRAVWNINHGKPVGMLEGNYHTVLGQLAAVAITWIFAATVTYVLLKLIDLTIGLRVPAHAERQGLDITQHGEEGYIFL